MENNKTCKDVHNILLKEKSRLHTAMYGINPFMQQKFTKNVMRQIFILAVLKHSQGTYFRM